MAQQECKIFVRSVLCVIDWVSGADDTQAYGVVSRVAFC